MIRRTQFKALIQRSIVFIEVVGAMVASAIVIGAMVASSLTAVADDARNTLPKQQHTTSGAPFLKPDEAVAKMAIPPGFAVSVFASEPDIAEPIAFCFDERGRMWVAENFNYRTRGEHTDEQVSRIQILEDTNGDGVFDKKKTFTDKLTFTSGLACGFGGVFVGSPPNLSFIPDENGDDKPDAAPQPLLNGWGINDRHETLNSFIWGPDGWLYGCHGVFTKSYVGHIDDDDSKRQFIDGGIWRYHPIRKTFEIFARGLSNPWGFDFNEHGQGFATCCVIPHLFHVVQGGSYTKQSLPHVNPHIYDDIKTIRDHAHLSAHGGARFYLADAFPKEYRNRLFMCNIHEHAVLTDVMEPNGSSFIGKHGDDFMPTNDLAWVGFSVEIGPEGGVYILDWHDTDVCGNIVNFPNSGRVYRILPKDAQAIKPPNLKVMSDGELVGLQAHENDWYVRQSRTVLHSRSAAGKMNRAIVHSQLENLFQSAASSPKRLRALWALQVTDGLGRDRMVKLLTHEDPYVRGWAIQFLCDSSVLNAFQDASNSNHATVDSEILDRFADMATNDPSPVVRLYLASAVQRMPFADRWRILEGLTSHEEDVNDNNLPRMYWFALEPMVPGNSREALKLAVAGKIPTLPEFVARRMVTGDAGANVEETANLKQDPLWQRTVKEVAPGFIVRDVGEGGVLRHASFRNAVAVQTHPLNRNTPSTLFREFEVPTGVTTRLVLRVSHHPHGDWQLRVLAGNEVLANKIIGAKTVGDDEWLDVSVDLSPFAGRKIPLTIENGPNGWENEWAYWNRVSIVSE